MAIMQSPPGPETMIDGRTYLYFSGTGYLGLQGHADIIRAACHAAERYGMGSATSRRGFGDMPPTLAVEREAAEFFDTEAALYFVSGYVGNHILAPRFKETFDQVFVDASSHYSILESLQLVGLPVRRFRHRDPEDLQRMLKTHLGAGQRPLVASDGVFAALGHIAPLREYYDLLADYPGAGMHIDDAHAVGVLGENGRGTYEHSGRSASGINTVAPHDGPRLFMTATLSKAIGGFGGILPVSHDLYAHIQTTSHYYDGASALPPPVAAATHRALQLVHAEPERRTRLRENVRQLKEGLRRLAFEVDDSPVPIINLSLGSAAQMQQIQRALMDRGIVISYRQSYSGLRAAGGLRIAVFATHNRSMIDRLIDELRQVV